MDATSNLPRFSTDPEEEPPARITLHTAGQWKESNRTLEWKHPHAIDCCFLAGRTFDPLPLALMTAYQCAIKSIVHQGDEENTQFRTVAVSLDSGSHSFFSRSSPYYCTLTPIQGQLKSLLQGQVKNVLLAQETDEFLVPVVLPNGENRVVIVANQQNGVVVENIRESFVPPFSLGDVTFQDVRVMDDNQLPDEDPRVRVLSPIHMVLVCLVLAVAVGYIKRVDESSNEKAFVEQLELISTERDLTDKQVHRELETLCQQVASLVSSTCPNSSDSSPILSVLAEMEKLCR